MFWNTLKNIFKKYFVAGLLVVIPITGTIWLLKILILWADSFFVSLLPSAFQPSFITSHELPGVGLILTIVIILGVGVFTRLYLGKKLIDMGEAILVRVPFGRSVYGALKQIMKTAFVRGEEKFKGVCLVEYPKEGSFAIAFITNEAGRAVSPDGTDGYFTVFVPTSPNPTSGFLLLVPKEKVRPLSISVEEASKLIISGGLL